MTGIDAFKYEGKRVVVVGGATGMGATTREDLRRTRRRGHRAGSRTGRLQRRAVHQGRSPRPGCDRRRAGCRRRCGARAGLGRRCRHIIDTFVADGRLGRGSSVCFISSVAGIGWEPQLETLVEFLGTESFDDAVAWVESHAGTDCYGFSNMAITAYVARVAFPMLRQGDPRERDPPRSDRYGPRRARTPTCGSRSARAIGMPRGPSSSPRSRWIRPSAS